MVGGLLRNFGIEISGARNCGSDKQAFHHQILILLGSRK
jgi:hypothetical protein